MHFVVAFRFDRAPFRDFFGRSCEATSSVFAEERQAMLLVESSKGTRSLYCQISTNHAYLGPFAVGSLPPVVSLDQDAHRNCVSSTLHHEYSKIHECIYICFCCI